MARKKKRSILKAFFIIALAAASVSVATYYLLDFFFKPAHITYPEFGIDIPAGYPIHGIDVSRYQRTIGWDEVKQMQVGNIKIGFVFIKATEGIGRIDPQFRRNWLKVDEKEIPKGAYHFFVCGESGEKQAQNFIDMVKLEKGDLPPVLDIEQANGATLTSIKKQVFIWLKKIEKEYKTRPVIYTNINFYNTYLGEGFEDYSFWIAHYMQPEKPRLIRKWLFWQHSERGHVNGIRFPVDFNVFSGDSTDFNNLLIK